MFFFSVIGAIQMRYDDDDDEYGYTQIVDMLLQHGADSNASLPICCALKKGYTDIVNLLMTHGADVNKQDQSGRSALIYFMESLTSQRSETSQVLNGLEERNLNILKSMLLAGGDLNEPSRCKSERALGLYIASFFGMCDVMMELIQHGAEDCNDLTYSGISAVDLACENGHEAAVELLLKNCPYTTIPYRTISRPTYSSDSSDDSYDYDRYEYELYEYESYRYNKESLLGALCTAAKTGSETIVKMLLNHRADVNASDVQGNTVLHLATSNAVVETLLNAGAKVHATNDSGETALSVVCEKRQADANVVETLLKFGADPNMCFPLHYACKKQRPRHSPAVIGTRC